MPQSAADFLDTPAKPKVQPQSADAFLDAGPKIQPTTTRTVYSNPPPKPAPAAPKKPGLGDSIAASAKAYLDLGKPYLEAVKRRGTEAAAQMSQDVAPDDLAGAIARPFNVAGGAFGWATAPIAAAIDVTVGKGLAEATKNAPSGEYYDMRLPERFAGDAAVTIGGFLVGGPKAMERPGEVPRAAERPRDVAARAAKHDTPPAPSAEAFLDAGAAAPKPKAPAASAEAFLDAAPAPAKKGKAKALAAAQPKDDLEIVAPEPSPHENVGPVVGGEADAVERVDNALYRLGGHSTADKIEASDFLKNVPKEISDPAVQEELYHAIEARLADPTAEIPEHLKPAMEAMRPWYEEQTAIINRLRERADPELEPYLEDQGYVARRVKGKSPLFDVAPGERPRDPIMGGRNLARTTTAQKARTAGYVVTDQDGNQFFSRGQPAETDIKGRPYANVRQATTAEIEAKTDLRYHKNAMVNTVDNVIRLRQVERNLQVLDELTKNLKAEGKAWQSEWRYRDEDGRTIVQRANSQRPEGFVELPHVPQLRGWYFEPKVAEALKDYYPRPDEPLEGVLAKVNRALTASLFVTPIPHAANVMNHWIVGRGWDWMAPGGYRNLMKTGAKAVREVLTLGPEYKRMLREGSGLLYGDTQVRDFHKLMMQKAGAEVFEDPKAVSVLAKAAGMPVEAVKGWYNLVNKSLWMANDIFMLQRQYELEAKGMSARKAIHEAERDIPNYRIPPQVMGSRAVSQWLRDPNIMMFGRYKYGQLRAWGTMIKDLVKGTKEQRIDAAGKALVALLVANVAYPIADAALKKVSGNKDAKVKRAGGFSQTDALEQMATGQKDAALALSSFMSLAPLVTEGVDLYTNHDFFGRPIRQPGSSPAAQALQAGEYVGSTAAYPVQLGMEAMKPGGAASAAGKLVGVELPPPGREEMKQKYRARDKKQALRHEARDPVEQALKKAFSK